MELNDLKEAIEAAIQSPSAFMALGLLLIVPLINKIVDKNDHAGLRYAALFSVVILAVAGFAWSVYGHYLAVIPTTELVMTEHQAPMEAVETSSTSGPEEHQPDTSSTESVVTNPEADPETTPTPEHQTPAREDCGEHWTGWIEVGGGVGSPCPSGCSRGREVGQSYRVVGFPPRTQTKHKFQCWR